MTPTKKTNTQIGRSGEGKAAAYLRGKGFEILETNFRSGRKEIDLIAQKETLLVFVEVKLRKGNFFGFPEEFLSAGQEERLTEAAEDYMYQKNWKGPIRFDIVAISGDQEILHIEDAF